MFTFISQRNANLGSSLLGKTAKTNIFQLRERKRREWRTNSLFHTSLLATNIVNHFFFLSAPAIYLSTYADCRLLLKLPSSWINCRCKGTKNKKRAKRRNAPLSNGMLRQFRKHTSDQKTRKRLCSKTCERIRNFSIVASFTTM